MMEKDYISSDSVMYLEFITNSETKLHYHENFELLYVLNGELSINVEGENYSLTQRDLIIVNYNRKHNYTGSDDLFVARFVISYSKVRELLSKDMMIFWCNSTLEKNESYDQLRRIIDQILNQHVIDPKKNSIYKISLHYQLLHVITKNFLLTSDDKRYEKENENSDDRMQEILQFVRANYQNSISLQDLADQFYLSTAYLSKYIKNKFNINFTELITSIRLSHAMVDLLYTDLPIMKIAINNGFASVAAYNKAFKEAYNMTPSQFKKSKNTTKQKENNKINDENSTVKKRLEEYLSENPIQLLEEGESKDTNILLDLDEINGGEWKNNYTRLINAGTALDLTKSDFQKQIKYLKSHLGAEYVRFWDIYAPELFLDIHAPSDKLNFSRLDSITDFLVDNQLKPYIELGFKPIRLLKNTQIALIEVPRNHKFNSDNEMHAFFAALLKHFIKRYGTEEVQQWYFEYWKNEDIDFSDLKYNYSPQTESVHREYFHRFDNIASTFRKILPEVKLGGGGFPIQHYGKKDFTELLEMWKKYKEYPDFLSLTCYPYQLEWESNVYYEKKSTDMFFIQNNLDTLRDAMQLSSFPKVPIHVSEYNLTLSNRNPINDHCAKGAFLIQNAISTIGSADIFGHWLGTDIYADLHDSQSFLFGGCGLLTKTGVPKPSFYALSFLKQLDKKIYKSEPNYVITGNSRGSFKILCHNFKKLNFNYYLMDESNIDVRSLAHLFEDNEPLNIKIRINNVENGVYIIKTSLVNNEYGSVQDELTRLNSEGELSLSEQDYLKRISTPRISSTSITVESKVLEINVQLKPNEFRYLNINPK
ncbi:helix-turn-helix domain-containing protein [Niallia sp. Man26]|uniref:GH39 family glycosyl hydrolase n=1 Tax=Niallia sp. Man26 TaxID=2912824 RepID=UPI001EDC17AD|nr:helix-turn-helix domain-containing protein [Niallia sp. Man26]UPO91070.1 helix-turn-helix domain-containing protein [Niallia sp. Man26]